MIDKSDQSVFETYFYNQLKVFKTLLWSLIFIFVTVYIVIILVYTNKEDLIDIIIYSLIAVGITAIVSIRYIILSKDVQYVQERDYKTLVGKVRKKTILLETGGKPKTYRIKVEPRNKSLKPITLEIPNTNIKLDTTYIIKYLPHSKIVMSVAPFLDDDLFDNF